MRKANSIDPCPGIMNQTQNHFLIKLSWSMPPLPPLTSCKRIMPEFFSSIVQSSERSSWGCDVLNEIISLVWLSSEPIDQVPVAVLLPFVEVRVPSFSNTKVYPLNLCVSSFPESMYWLTFQEPSGILVFPFAGLMSSSFEFEQDTISTAIEIKITAFNKLCFYIVVSI